VAVGRRSGAVRFDGRGAGEASNSGLWGGDRRAMGGGRCGWFLGVVLMGCGVWSAYRRFSYAAVGAGEDCYLSPGVARAFSGTAPVPSALLDAVVCMSLAGWR